MATPKTRLSQLVAPPILAAGAPRDGREAK